MASSTRTDAVASALRDTLISPNEGDSNFEPANIVDAVAQMGRDIRSGLKWLGNGDAASPMGAIEHHAVCVLEAADKINSGLESVAEAITRLAEAIEPRNSREDRP